MQLRRIKQRTIARHKAGSLFYKDYRHKLLKGVVSINGVYIGTATRVTFYKGEAPTTNDKRNEYGRPIICKPDRFSFTMQLPSVDPERLRLALYGE